MIYFSYINCFQKPKRIIKKNGQPPVKRPKVQKDLDEEITSEEDEYVKGKQENFEEYETAEDLETAQEKKVRLARQYIKELEEQSKFQGAFAVDMLTDFYIS